MSKNICISMKVPSRSNSSCSSNTGSWLKSRNCRTSSGPVDYLRAAGQIHRAALKLMVGHEIDYAVTRLRSELAQLKPGSDELADRPDAPENGSAAQFAHRRRIQELSGLITLLETVQEDDRPLAEYLKDSRTAGDSTFQADGVVEYVTPARFMPFPFCLDALLQVAAMNLEFFHVRFLLACLIGSNRPAAVCLCGCRKNSGFDLS